MSVGSGAGWEGMGEAMECDVSDGCVTPMECFDEGGGWTGNRERVQLDDGSGQKVGGGARRMGGLGVWADRGKRATTPGTPTTPRPPMSQFPPPTSFLSTYGGSWEGEVADVAALMAGLGAHVACEEAAAAAVAADVHRQLAELAKGWVICLGVCLYVLLWLWVCVGV